MMKGRLLMAAMMAIASHGLPFAALSNGTIPGRPRAKREPEGRRRLTDADVARMEAAQRKRDRKNAKRLRDAASS